MDWFLTSTFFLYLSHSPFISNSCILEIAKSLVIQNSIQKWKIENVQKQNKIIDNNFFSPLSSSSLNILECWSWCSCCCRFFVVHWRLCLWQFNVLCCVFLPSSTTIYGHLFEKSKLLAITHDF
jgi:hypothetical protein